jgi:hypothetical protein
LKSRRTPGRRGPRAFLSPAGLALLLAIGRVSVALANPASPAAAASGCADLGEPRQVRFAKADGPFVQKPIASYDAIALRGRRIWIHIQATNPSAEPVSITPILRFDPKPDGSVSFGQSQWAWNLAPGASGERVLRAYALPNVRVVDATLSATTATPALDLTVTLRCSEQVYTPGAPSAEDALVHEAGSLYFARALHASENSQDAWQTLALRATGSEDSQDVADAVAATMYSLGDWHSYFFARAELPTFYGNLAAQAPRAEWLDGGIAVLTLEAAAFPDHDGVLAYARAIRAAISPLASRRPVGWILDLRDLGGGDMWSVLAGVSSLVGAGEVGAFRTRTGLEHWIVSPGRSAVDDQVLADIGAAGEPPAFDGPLAVLQGPATASSGEALAVAFHERPRTRFFGASTMGFTNTGVRQHILSDGSMFGIAEVENVDRGGHLHAGALPPDESTAPGDAALQAARAWIQSHGSPAR